MFGDFIVWFIGVVMQGFSVVVIIGGFCAGR